MESKEFVACNELCKAMNDTTWDEEKFAQALLLQHRTIQQNFFRTIQSCIKVMANSSCDDRNRSSVEWCKEVVDNTKEYYFPLI